MSSEITREEIAAVINASSKVTEQLVLITERLKDITDCQQKISQRLYNGMAKDIGENVSKEVNLIFSNLNKSCEMYTKQAQDIAKKVEDVRSDVFWLKTIIGGATLIALIAGVLLKIIK